MGSSSRNLWIQKKNLIWPNIIFTTERAVYVMKNKEIKAILENQEDDRCYHGISWSNNDLYISGEGCLYKYYRTMKKRYRREVPGIILKLHVKIPIVYAYTNKNTCDEYDIGLIPIKRNSEFPKEDFPIEGDDCIVEKSGTKLIFIAKKGKLIEEVDMKEKIYEIRSLEEGFEHNKEAFPIKELL